MDSLPAYHELDKDVATLVAPYLDTHDLYSGCLVCSHFNQIFGDYLWANPFRDLANRTKPCELVSRFLSASDCHNPEILKRVRIIDMRALHEIKRDRAHTSDYIIFGTHLKPELFFKFFKNFPNLNCVLLAPTCSEDYGILHGSELPSEYNDIPQLEFFSAAGCTTFNCSLILRQNITKHLIYLDASGTARSPNWRALFTIENLPNIRILKLRGLRLMDTMLPPIVTNSRLQIWSLDLRDNLLTDNVILSLLRSCFLARFPGITYGPLRAADEYLFEHPPFYREADEGADSIHTTMTILRPDNIKLVEWSTPGGLALYISNNKFTHIGIQYLLSQTNSLQVLDVGSSRTNLPPDVSAGVDVFAQACVIPLLSRKRKSRLEVLRIHHSVITLRPSVISQSNRHDDKEAISNDKTGEKCKINLEKQAPLFDPHHNTRLRSLTLTSIPRKSNNKELFLSLKSFLTRLAAQETKIRHARQNIKSRRAPLLYPGLRNLKLEFLPDEQIAQSSEAGSVTGDGDADSYYQEMARDFSFLNQENSRTSTTRSEQQEEIESVHMVDVVEELKKWRKIDVGRWSGELRIVLF